MPQKATLLLPALTHFDVKALPEIIFVGLSCAAGFENEITLLPVRAFLPKFFDRRWFCGTAPLYEDILNFKFELFVWNERHRSIIIDTKDGRLLLALADEIMRIQ